MELNSGKIRYHGQRNSNIVARFSDGIFAANRLAGSILFLKIQRKADLVEVLSHILQRTSRVMNMEINMSADRFEQRAHDIGRVLSGDTIIEGLLLMKAEYFHQSVW